MPTNAGQDNRLIIFDTTLRDGEQSPGASMNLAEKLEVALALKELGVDVIEAGFPIASPGDFEAVQSIARQVQGPMICGLARCNDADIDRAWEALKESPKPRIHVFLATSFIHREFKLHMAKDEIVRRPCERAATTFASQPGSAPSDCCRPAGSCRASPAFPCSATRRSSARMRSPTRRASIRTAC